MIHHHAAICYDRKYNDVEQFERLGVFRNWCYQNGYSKEEILIALKQARANLNGKPEQVEVKPETMPEVVAEFEIKHDSRRAPPPMIDTSVSASGTRLRSKDPTRKSILDMADEKRKG